MTANHHGSVSHVGLRLDEITVNRKFFWKKVDKTTDHWAWTGSRAASGRGAGQWSIAKGKLRQAARVAWVLENGTDIPPGAFLVRTCDMPQCVNPAHRKLTFDRGEFPVTPRPTPEWVCKARSQTPSPKLFKAMPVGPGTVRAAQTGRTHKNCDCPADPTLYGRCGRPRLTDAQVADMRRRHLAGEIVRALAAEFGIAHGHCSDILHGRNFKHLPDVCPVNHTSGTARAA